MNGVFSEINQGYFQLKKNYMLESAKKHYRASKIGKPLYPKKTCHCCKMNSNKEDFTMNSENKEFRYVGIGYALFFETLSCLQKFFLVMIMVGICFTFFEFLKYKIRLEKVNSNSF